MGHPVENVPRNRSCGVGTVNEVECVPQHPLWHLRQFQQPVPARVRQWRREEERRQVRARRVRRLDGALVGDGGIGSSIINVGFLVGLFEIPQPSSYVNVQHIIWDF